MVEYEVWTSVVLREWILDEGKNLYLKLNHGTCKTLQEAMRLKRERKATHVYMVTREIIDENIHCEV